MKSAILYISGNVQRVGYRKKAIYIAKKFDIKGIVSNQPDGRVKIIAEGEDADLDQFIDALYIKNALINVTNIEKEYSTPLGEYKNFYKLVSDGETDERLDTAADLLKDLIAVVKGGFNDLGKKQDVMIEKQDTTIKILSGVKEDTSTINDKFSTSKEDIKDIFYDKYEYLAREIVDIKATVSEIKAKVM